LRSGARGLSPVVATRRGLGQPRRKTAVATRRDPGSLRRGALIAAE
jgi:hypothetical protein